MSDTDHAGGRRTKVARLVDEYDLIGVGDELEARWTATGDDHTSLRDLAAAFNRKLIEARLDEAGVRLTEREIDAVRRLLTGDEVSAADRTHLRRRLERDGVDVDTLDGDVVTYQAIRSYLRDHRGAEYERADGDRGATVAEAIEKLRGRLASVTETKLDGLRKTPHLDLGEFRVAVDVRVFCTECDSRYGVVELLSSGGCDCSEARTTGDAEPAQ
ncbi:rod-determining factor RdfA [Halorubrum amylolyticum]|uniref:rod-determining factor RdfA n=1 Tax=Halorubrum amylolyticum TaxID=2508724 RepID=UPI0010092F81|nr:rod-determining factor RdfA [Halorubrum amylolyticum]